MVSVMPTPNRVFRIPSDIYDEAKRIAQQRGDSLTSIVIAALHEYVKKHGRNKQ